MSFATLRRTVYALAIVAALTVLAGWSLVSTSVRARLPAEALTVIASTLLAVPMCIHLAFLVIQGLPGGRRIVPLPLTRSPDVWLQIFVLTMFVPKEQLAALAAEPWRAAETGVPISLVTTALAVAARVWQLNRGASLGVTHGPGPEPG